jgi:hypothetical protein
MSPPGGQFQFEMVIHSRILKPDIEISKFFSFSLQVSRENAEAEVT